jgi:apolipoprotein N-acyltransferase
MLLAFPPYDLHALAWIGLVPLFLAVEGASNRGTYALCLLMGTVLVCGGYPWLNYLAEHFGGVPWPLSYGLWLLYGVYSAHLFAAIFLAQRYVERDGLLPRVLSFPILAVALWSVFPNIFFFTLANGMTGFLPALQASEFTGAFGVDFAIALANVAVYQLVRFPARARDRVAVFVSVVYLGGWLGYGVHALGVWDERIESWSSVRLGLVQPNRPPTKNPDEPPEPGYTRAFPLEMGFTRGLVDRGAELVIWPEGRFFGFHHREEVRIAFEREIATLGVPLIFQDYVFEKRAGNLEQKNVSVFLRGDGQRDGVYAKRYRVPLGEYIPVLEHFPKVVAALGLPSLSAGVAPAFFRAGSMRITPLICYEIQFSDFTARALATPEDPDPAGAAIVIHSNDGWYGSGTQAEQHRSSTVLRAVENRVPVIHALNNGQSSVILPSGRYVFLADDWTRGSFPVDLPFDPESGGGFVTRHPDLFENTIRGLALAIGALVFARRRRAKTE